MTDFYNHNKRANLYRFLDKIKYKRDSVLGPIPSDDQIIKNLLGITADVIMLANRDVSFWSF